MDFDQAFVKDIQLIQKMIIIHMHLLSDAFHSTVSVEQPSFTAIEYK